MPCRSAISGSHAPSRVVPLAVAKPSVALTPSPSARALARALQFLAQDVASTSYARAPPGNQATPPDATRDPLANLRLAA
jgi:hypothetical protein